MRPQVGVFRTADLIFRFERTLHTPKRPATRVETRSEERRHIREVRNYEEMRKEVKSRVLGTGEGEKGGVDNEIRLFENSPRQIRPNRAFTPTFTKSTLRSGLSPLRLRSYRVTREGLYHRLLAACKEVQPAKSLEASIDKERLEASQELKRWKQAYDRFERMREMEPELLVPLYALEKGADVFNESEVLNTARNRRITRSPVQRFLTKALRKS